MYSDAEKSKIIEENGRNFRVRNLDTREQELEIMAVDLDTHEHEPVHGCYLDTHEHKPVDDG
jgi:hypothetical protein